MAQSPSSPSAVRAAVTSWAANDADAMEALSALENYKKKDTSKGKESLYLFSFSSSHCNKVVVRFKAVGNAPIMKQNFYKITASNRFQAVIQFLRKELNWKAGDPLVSPPFA
jgi:ubiquitin-like protein ATG12